MQLLSADDFDPGHPVSRWVVGHGDEAQLPGVGSVFDGAMIKAGVRTAIHLMRGNGIGAAWASPPLGALTNVNRIDGGQWPGVPSRLLLIVMCPPSFEWSRRGALFVLAVVVATGWHAAAKRLLQ